MHRFYISHRKSRGNAYRSCGESASYRKVNRRTRSSGKILKTVQWYLVRTTMTTSRRHEERKRFGCWMNEDRQQKSHANKKTEARRRSSYVRAHRQQSHSQSENRRHVSTGNQPPAVLQHESTEFVVRVYRAQPGS